MPPVKKPQRVYGIQHLMEPELLKFTNARGWHFSREEVLPLISIAVKPEMMNWPRTSAKDSQRFWQLFARRPDETLAMMVFLRGKLARWNRQPPGFTRWFLREHSYIKNSKGERLAIIDMQDQEIAAHLTKPGLMSQRRL